MFSRLVCVLLAVALLSDGAHAQCRGSATYKVFNACFWSVKRHPKDYPVSTAHFSPLCGTSHTSEYTLFKRRGRSTAGVKQMAETGACTLLEGEIEDCVGDGYCPNNGFKSWPCKTINKQKDPPTDGICRHRGEVTVTRKFPYVSFVSMIAPSPDWFVGVSGVSLCQEIGDSGKYGWVDRYPANKNAGLYAHDAGTDSGTSYASRNSRTSPARGITIFKAKDDSNIFYNEKEGELYPICFFRMVKV